MLLEQENFNEQLRAEPATALAADASPLAFSQRAVAALRQVVRDRGCASFRIFHCVCFDLFER